MDTLQVVAEPRRREILRLTWERELSAGEIASRFNLTFGAISQHLRVLRDAGLVAVRESGNQRFYRAEPGRLGPLREVLELMWSANLERLAKAVEAE